MNIAMKLPPSFSFRSSCGFVVILSLMNGACSSQGTEFERDPVIKRFIAGPVEFRFYASPATDGGAATNFKVGESLFLVSTVANFTGEEQICEPDYSKIYLPSCGSPPSVSLRRGVDTVWDNQSESIGIPCGEDVDLADWGLPKQITVPADFVQRGAIEAHPKEPLIVGKYVAEWRIPNEPLNAILSSCGSATAITAVTLTINVWPK